jgi:hypothetical protein
MIGGPLMRDTSDKRNYQRSSSIVVRESVSKKYYRPNGRGQTIVFARSQRTIIDT